MVYILKYLQLGPEIYLAHEKDNNQTKTKTDFLLLQPNIGKQAYCSLYKYMTAGVI